MTTDEALMLVPRTHEVTLRVYRDRTALCFLTGLRRLYCDAVGAGETPAAAINVAAGKISRTSDGEGDAA